MLRTTLAAAMFVTVAASGGGAMAGAGKFTGNARVIKGAVATVADNAPPAAQDPLSTDQVEKFRESLKSEKRPSARAKLDVKVGSVVPKEVEFYAVGPQWNMSGYKYALINDKTVIVDPKSRKIIQVLDTTKDVTKAKKGTADR